MSENVELIFRTIEISIGIIALLIEIYKLKR